MLIDRLKKGRKESYSCSEIQKTLRIIVMVQTGRLIVSTTFFNQTKNEIFMQSKNLLL